MTYKLLVRDVPICEDCEKESAYELWAESDVMGMSFMTGYYCHECGIARRDQYRALDHDQAKAEVGS